MPTVSEADQAGIKRRAARRGLRSLNGRFYHTKAERSAADRVFNKAVAAVKAAKQSGAIRGEDDQSKAAPFDFEYKQDEIIKPAAEGIVTPRYWCNNCHSQVTHGTPICPACSQLLNWAGL